MVVGVSGFSAHWGQKGAYLVARFQPCFIRVATTLAAGSATTSPTGVGNTTPTTA